MATTTKNLGLVKAIHSGSTPPSNTSMIWYNTGINAYIRYRHYYYNTSTLLWSLLTGIIFYEFNSGALVKNVTKTITHNQNLSNYFINVRTTNDDNNVGTTLLRPNLSDPANKIDIRVGVSFPSGLKIQIIGT